MRVCITLELRNSKGKGKERKTERRKERSSIFQRNTTISYTVRLTESKDIKSILTVREVKDRDILQILRM